MVVIVCQKSHSYANDAPSPHEGFADAQAPPVKVPIFMLAFVPTLLFPLLPPIVLSEKQHGLLSGNSLLIVPLRVMQTAIQNPI